MIRRPYIGTEPRPEHYTFIRKTGLRDYDFVAPWYRQINPLHALIGGLLVAAFVGCAIAFVLGALS